MAGSGGLPAQHRIWEDILNPLPCATTNTLASYRYEPMTLYRNAFMDANSRAAPAISNVLAKAKKAPS